MQKADILIFEYVSHLKFSENALTATSPLRFNTSHYTSYVRFKKQLIFYYLSYAIKHQSKTKIEIYFSKPIHEQNMFFNILSIYSTWPKSKHKSSGRTRRLISVNQLSLIRIRIIRTFTNSNDIRQSPQNFLTNTHQKPL